ncbi:MAG: diphthine--ammonia ligase [Candidatus Omnitrophota bacterium]
MKESVLFSWSGGKDSAFALYEFKKNTDFEITALLTTITEDYGRVSMHGIRRSLLERQGQMLGIPVEKVSISKNDSHDDYSNKMESVLRGFLEKNVRAVVFGDIFLEDLRRYREDNLAKIGMKALFPIWKKETSRLAHEFIDLGFKAVITCVDGEYLDRAFVGRAFDREFLSELPTTIDPCGENGEFHSFAYDGPIFQKGIAHTLGDIVLRDDRFYYCDVVPDENKEQE